MRKAIFSILILIPFLSLSQINQIDANGQRQGFWTKEQPNGKLLYEGNFRDGQPVGEWKRYHEGGQIKAKINYRENSDSAFAQLFDVFGKKVAEGNYINEIKEGKWIIFSENRKVAEENYHSGLLDGLSRKYYDTGELLEETEWEEGKQEGNYRVFFKSGKPYLQCKMSNNQRNGLCISYFENGMTELEAFYTNSLHDKTWKFYDESGKLLYELHYEAGKILNPEVRDSIENQKLQQLEKQKGNILDPEKFLHDPSQYMINMGIYR
jgi:antitoxin component YwqK of YwqJK toxin-antitoxin module